MMRNRSVKVHQFSMIPRSDIPRSAFDMEFAHKTTMNSGYLVPFYVERALPGDTFKVSHNVVARMATLINPIMDNIYADTFYFAIPYRLLWDNFVKMQGEQTNPGDSVAYTTPQMVSPAGGYAIGSLQDYMGLPTLGQVTAGQTVSHSALELRAYNLVIKEWFRDENLQNSPTIDKGDAASIYSNFNLVRRGKRRDYFTSCLPSPQKGAAVTLPLGTRAPVSIDSAIGSEVSVYSTAAGAYKQLDPATFVNLSATTGTLAKSLYADLSTATAATINSIRQAFQIQRLLERDMRGGTRYVEALQARFGVTPQDFRLQRPEYLGGGSTHVNINPIVQTSATLVSGSTTPLGQLGAMGTASGKHGFSYSFLEHCIVLGLISIRADLTYQQGMDRHWSKLTRYDMYEPVFAHLGEQAVLNKEIYCKGDSTAADAQVFGYQERWAEYRYKPSMVTGLFRSTAAGTLDPWHLGEKFLALPTLGDTFIQSNPPIARVIAVPSQPEFIVDTFGLNRAVRPMPMYSVPGLIDHF